MLTFYSVKRDVATTSFLTPIFGVVAISISLKCTRKRDTEISS